VASAASAGSTGVSTTPSTKSPSCFFVLFVRARIDVLDAVHQRLIFGGFLFRHLRLLVALWPSSTESAIFVVNRRMARSASSSRE